MMRRFLFIVTLSALLVPHPARAAAGRANFQRRPQSASPGARGIASIKAYCQSLERHFKRNASAARFFVDALPEGGAEPAPEGQLDWHEVKSEDEMREAERAYANHSIVVKTKDGELVYADFAEPREHSRRHHEYCFRPDGTLAKITSDYYSGIAGIHVTRESFYGTEGKLLRSMDSCFNLTYTSNGSREKRAPCRRAEMREGMTGYSLPVYKKNADLPGYEILRTRKS
ncbi:MAG TPA: hypothetical protein VJ715_18470 [Pyrinomonadaceae bacterium]|nr:hypothetical protein [Pyrinomonadaceae bacterium]